MQAMVEERGMPMELHDAQFKRIDERILESDRRVAELAKDTNRRFDETNRRLDETNQRITETNQRITETSVSLKGEIKETRETVKDLGQQMHSLQTTFIRGHFALVASVVGAIFALLIKGG
jgi:methyl-accepting chemotaxis protein